MLILQFIFSVFSRPKFTIQNFDFIRSPKLLWIYYLVYLNPETESLLEATSIRIYKVETSFKTLWWLMRKRVSWLLSCPYHQTRALKLLYNLQHHKQAQVRFIKWISLWTYLRKEKKQYYHVKTKKIKYLNKRKCFYVKFDDTSEYWSLVSFVGKFFSYSIVPIGDFTVFGFGFLTCRSMLELPMAFHLEALVLIYF